MSNDGSAVKRAADPNPDPDPDPPPQEDEGQEQALCLVDADANADAAATTTTTTTTTVAVASMDDVDDDALGCILVAIRIEDFAPASLVCRRWHIILKASVERSPALLSIRGFHAAFGKKTIWSCINEFGRMDLRSYRCSTTEQVEALAAFIESNAEIENWNGTIR